MCQRSLTDSGGISLSAMTSTTLWVKCPLNKLPLNLLRNVRGYRTYPVTKSRESLEQVFSIVLASADGFLVAVMFYFHSLLCNYCKYHAFRRLAYTSHFTYLTIPNRSVTLKQTNLLGEVYTFVWYGSLLILSGKTFYSVSSRDKASVTSLTNSKCWLCI